MKIKIVLAAILLTTAAVAQVGISPLNAEFGKKASDQLTVTNSGIIPVAVTIEARTLSQGGDGNLVLGKIDPAVIKVKLKETSARVDAKSSHTFDYDVKCVRCALVLFASVTPIQKMKPVEDATDAGVKVVMHFGESVYVCPKAKGCRLSFTDAWGLGRQATK